MPKDFLIDSTGDLIIDNGDFAVGESTVQNQKVLFATKKGEWKQSVATGVGAIDYVNDDALEDLAQEIRKQFVADGMTVNSVDVFDSGKVSWDASY